MVCKRRTLILTSFNYRLHRHNYLFVHYSGQWLYTLESLTVTGHYSCTYIQV